MIPSDFEYGLEYIKRNKEQLLKLCSGPTEQFIVEKTLDILINPSPVVVTRDDDGEIVRVDHNGKIVAMTTYAGGKPINRDIQMTDPKRPNIEDLVVTMYAMLADLEAGYPWKELGINMDEIESNIEMLGLEHEVIRTKNR